MAATQVAQPFHRENWVYEEKVDGYRMAYKDGDPCQAHQPRGGRTLPHSPLSWVPDSIRHPISTQIR